MPTAEFVAPCELPIVVERPSSHDSQLVGSSDESDFAGFENLPVAVNLPLAVPAHSANVKKLTMHERQIVAHAKLCYSSKRTLPEHWTQCIANCDTPNHNKIRKNKQPEWRECTTCFRNINSNCDSGVFNVGAFQCIDCIVQGIIITIM